MSLKGFYIDDSAEVAHHKVYSNCLRGFIGTVYDKELVYVVQVTGSDGEVYYRIAIMLVMGEGLPRCEQW